jgi:aspartate dehydrogenase
MTPQKSRGDATDDSQKARSLTSPRRTCPIGVIGFGAIGVPIVEELRQERIPGCNLAGVLTRSQLPDHLKEYSVSSLNGMIDRSDLVIEAAGHTALSQFGPAVIESGTDLLVLSAGALVDEGLLARLTADGGGRLMISTGAIGGLDTLLAAMLVHPLDSVSLTSRKASRVLVRSWMPVELQEALSSGDGETEAYNGPAREAVALFPESANIAATLALATVGWDRLHVRMVGVPDATEVEHRVSAIGRAGSYEFVFRNRPIETNPRTSAITPYSVIRALSRLQARTVIGV